MTPQQIREFILAGNALFTLKSLRTNKHLTYKVQRRMQFDAAAGRDVPLVPASWIVKVLNGPDNSRNYKYIGHINADGGYFTSATMTPARQGFKWCWEHLERCGERFEFAHAGRCGRCGRLLTRPDSIESGIGPECADKMAFEAAGGVDGLMNQLFGGCSIK